MSRHDERVNQAAQQPQAASTRRHETLIISHLPASNRASLSTGLNYRSAFRFVWIKRTLLRRSLEPHTWRKPNHRFDQTRTTLILYILRFYDESSIRPWFFEIVSIWNTLLVFLRKIKSLRINKNIKNTRIRIYRKFYPLCTKIIFSNLIRNVAVRENRDV